VTPFTRMVCTSGIVGGCGGICERVGTARGRL
jgi:hypothetical protein